QTLIDALIGVGARSRLTCAAKSAARRSACGAKLNFQLVFRGRRKGWQPSVVAPSIQVFFDVRAEQKRFSQAPDRVLSRFGVERAGSAQRLDDCCPYCGLSDFSGLVCVTLPQRSSVLCHGGSAALHYCRIRIGKKGSRQRN